MPLALPNAVQPTGIKTFAQGDGINGRDFQQLLANSFVSLVNYWKPGIGRFRKAPGSDLFVEITESDDPTNGGQPISFAVQVNSDLWYLAYGTSLTSYVPSTEVKTVIKEFSADVTWIELYSDWIYIASGLAGEKINYVATVSAPNTAVVITDAPKADVLTIVTSNRLAAGATDADSSEIHVSGADSLTGVPFSQTADWTVGTDPASPFKVTYRRAGTLKGFGKLGQQVVALFDLGSLGFQITQVNVSGTGLVLDTPINWENLDFGSTRGVRNTSKGIFFANEFGVWQMTSGGLKDVPFSGINQKVSESLGDKFLQNYDFSDSDIELDSNRDLLLVTARDNADANNVVLIYHFKKNLQGWSVWDKDIRRFIRVVQDIYYTSSLTTKIFKLNYDRGDDDGVKFSTEFTIEPQINGLGQLSALARFMLGYTADKGQEFTVDFSIFDRKGVFLENHKTLSIISTAENVGEIEGMTSGGMTSTAISAGQDIFDNLPFNLYSKPVATYDFTRLRCSITTTDLGIHELNFANFITTPRGIADTAI